MQQTEKNEIKKLKNQDEFEKNNNIISKLKWILPEAEYYFIIEEYNIEGVHYAINLKKNDNCNPIIAIYEHVNNYRFIATSFSNLVKQYLIDGPEAII